MSSDQGITDSNCFKCDHPRKPDQVRCLNCGWGGGSGLAEEDDHHLVLVSLIYRVIESGTKVMPYISKIDATARELAVLNHGDQCEIEGTKWRISGKNTERELFFVKGFRVIPFPNRRYFEFEHGDPIDEIREEMKRWKHLHSAYYEMWQLKKRRELRGYLRRPERKKAIYRSRIQDESPYMN